MGGGRVKVDEDGISSFFPIALMLIAVVVSAVIIMGPLRAKLLALLRPST